MDRSRGCRTADGFYGLELFSLAMDVSWKKVGGSPFSTYMALLNLSMVIAYKLSTPVASFARRCAERAMGTMMSRMACFSDVELLPYALIYIAMALFRLIVLIPLLSIDPEQAQNTLDK